MGLLEEATEAQRGRSRGPRCSVAVAMEQMSEEDRADLQKLLDEGTVFFSTLSEVLRGRGVPISAEALSRHGRKKVCACHRTGLPER